jgi:hypothetical protein
LGTCLKYSLLLLLFCAVSSVQAVEGRKLIPSSSVELRDPRAISLSKEGLLYIADTGHNRVIAVDSSGKLIAETGGFGTAHGQFQWPQDIRADFSHMVWVVDYGNRRIEKFTRSLVYQGTFEIKSPGDDSKHQPETMTLSPQGDIYVYDRDGGRLICYDPLFTIRAEYGGNSGSAFVSDVSNMVFVPNLGLVWRMRGQSELHSNDLLLNPMTTLRLPDSKDKLALSVMGNCAVYASTQGVFQTCWNVEPTVELISSQELAETGIKQIDGIAFPTDSSAYVLDGKASALFLINFSRK